MHDVKLDEDLSSLVAEPLIARGHVVTSVFEQGWSGIDDDTLFRRVQGEHRMLITADSGFYDLRKYVPGTHFGIVVLRPERESIFAYRQLVELLLQRHDLQELEGSLILVSPDRVRIRRKPL